MPDHTDSPILEGLNDRQREAVLHGDGALLIYAGAAWACFELIDAVTERLGLPVWLPGLAIVLFLLALPVVLATAFVDEEPALAAPPHEATEAEAKEAEAKAAAARYEARRRHRLLTWRNAGLSFVGALAVWGVVATGWYVLDEGGAAESSDARRSIAVLPFENLSGDDENEAFTNGVHDVILTHLYKIADLRPTSRTSVMEYRDTRKNIRQIAEELGVETVMVGGVQRAGDRVLVNVQLIDAQTDEHIWAETYDRELTLENIFAIEAEIAQHIATSLRADVTDEEKERLAGLPTDNSEAYDYYLTGEEYLRRRGGPPGGIIQNLTIAKEMFSSAIALDPEFALAYAKLSMAHLNLRVITNPEFRTHERLDSAKVAAEKALELDPDLPEAHISLGRSYVALQDHDRASQHYAIAQRLSPNDTEIWRILGARANAQSNFEEALRNYKQALDLSPRDERVLLNLGTTYLGLRRYDEAEMYLDRLNSIAPDRLPGSYWKVFVVLNQPDGRERAWNVMQEWQDITGYPRFWGADRYRNRMFLRVFHERVRDVVRSYTREDWEDLGWSAHDLFLAKAISYELDDEVEPSLAYYDSARAALESFVQRLPENAFIRQNLGVAYAGLGRVEEAVREGKAAVELMTPTSEFAVNRPSMLWSLAEIYVMVEDREAAIDQLELLLSIPADFSTAILELDPLYDPLRDHPRFQALLKEYEQ